MGFIGSLIAGIAQALFSAIGNFFTSLIQRSDEQALGQQTQAATDANAQTAAANANTQKVAGVVQAENASFAKSVADPSGLRDADPDSRD